MRRLPIYFEALPCALTLTFALSLFEATAGAATVSGRIEIVAPSEHSHKQEQVDLSDLVVWLEPLKNLPVQPLDTGRVRLLQKNKMFTPHVLAITVGTIVDFPNADPIFHSAFSNYNGQLFDLSLYPPGTTKSVRFHRPGIVRIFCNIHPSMAAVIVVLDTPYFTKTKSDGTYRLPDIPPGNYELHVFDERSTGDTREALLVAVPDGEAALEAPTARVSEEGYVPLPHKNKYGLDYPVDRDASGYSGAPK